MALQLVHQEDYILGLQDNNTTTKADHNQGKKISDGKSGLPENLLLPVVFEKRIPAKF